MATPRVSRGLLAARVGQLAAPLHTARASSILYHRLPAYRTITSKARPQDVQAFHSQLEDPRAASFFSALKSRPTKPPQTLTEKIVQAHAVGLPDGKYVQSGDYVTLQPARCMTHDNSWPVARKFMAAGASKIQDPSQIVITIDHAVQDKSESNLKKYAQIEEFANQQGVDFYPAGRGIGHQIMVEEGYAWPGTLAVASDSHTNMYGGIGCLGTPVVRTDAAAIWATQKCWWQIPPTAKVNFKGTLPKGVTGKDVIVALCGLFPNDEVLNHTIEFVGSEETLRSIAIDDRLTIANMTTEWGALSGLFPIDSVLQAWLRMKATEAALFDASKPTAQRFSHQKLDELFANPITADPGAKYAKELYLDLSTLSPYVSGPNSVKVATPIAELETENIKCDRAYLVSCTNSRRSDIAAAAQVFRDAAETNGGKIPKIPEHVNFYLAAASLPEQQAAEEQGDWQVLLEAGAQPLPAGCGPCIGLGTGLLQPGETGVSASNRNFKGRMGSTAAKAYLASPEVVAASALKGVITGPNRFKKPEGYQGVVLGEGDGIKEEERMISIEDALDKLVREAESMVVQAEKEVAPVEAELAPVQSSAPARAILEGFPEKVAGEIVFVSQDNCNTDAIYPGKYTYQDGITKEKMAEVVMENYDPKFASIAKPGDILVSGFNFGCGSSREQAATAILAKGIPLVVAGSFGNIFSRNSINNALLGLEIPELVKSLREAFPSEGNPLTIRTGWQLEWDVATSTVHIKQKDGKTWSKKVGEMPPNVQAIVARGGLENWVKAEIAQQS